MIRKTGMYKRARPKQNRNTSDAPSDRTERWMAGELVLMDRAGSCFVSLGVESGRADGAVGVFAAETDDAEDAEDVAQAGPRE